MGWKLPVESFRLDALAIIAYCTLDQYMEKPAEPNSCESADSLRSRPHSKTHRESVRSLSLQAIARNAKARHALGAQGQGGTGTHQSQLAGQRLDRGSDHRHAHSQGQAKCQTAAGSVTSTSSWNPPPPAGPESAGRQQLAGRRDRLGALAAPIRPARPGRRSRGPGRPPGTGPPGRCRAAGGPPR